MKRKSENIITSFLTACCFIVLFSGCEKDIVLYTPYENQTQNFEGDINEFFDLAQTDAQLFTIDSNSPEMITTQSGMRVHFEANSFVTVNNVLIDGDITIEVVELLNKGDILKYNIPTITTHQILETVVQFHILAKQNDEELLLLADASVKVQFPDNEQLESVELFTESSNELGNFIWTEADDDPNSSNNVFATEWLIDNNLQVGYECENLALGWSAFSSIVDYSTDQTIVGCIDLQEQFVETNTVVFLVYQEMNTIIPLIKNAETELFCTNDLLKNFDVTTIVISHQGNDSFQFGSNDINVAAELTETMKPNDTPFSDIMSFLNDL